MDENQRLHLQKMITTNNVEDNTSLIRTLKHSHILRRDIDQLITLKATYLNEPDKVHMEAMSECNFLFTYYTDIYNKIRKDEIDLAILYQALDVLRKIEDGQLDQHEGAFQFGTLLKQIYVDSALKKADKLNAQTGDLEPEYKGPQSDITWAEFKQRSRK